MSSSKVEILCEEVYQTEVLKRNTRVRNLRLATEAQIDQYIAHIPNIVGRYPRSRRLIYLRTLDNPFQDEYHVVGRSDYHPLWNAFQDHHKWFVATFLKKIEEAGYSAKYCAGFFWIKNPLYKKK